MEKHVTSDVTAQNLNLIESSLQSNCLLKLTRSGNFFYHRFSNFNNKSNLFQLGKT